MQQIIGGKRYNTETANGVANDRYWDGNNMERSGRNTYLYRTKRGSFFLEHTTCWQGERDVLEAITIDEAKRYYEELPEHEMSWEDAFGEEPEEA